MSELEPTLLLVDDSEVNLDMLSRRLQRKGFIVLTASSGQAALDIVAKQPVDLVVLDLMMPEMDGIEVLRRLRLQTQGPAIPVIMATAKTDASDMVSALDHGADDYVTKPIEIDVLNARIRALLRRRPTSSQPSPSPAPSAAGDSAMSLDGVPPVPPWLTTRPLLPSPSQQGGAPPPATYMGPGTVLDDIYRLE